MSRVKGTYCTNIQFTDQGPSTISCIILSKQMRIIASKLDEIPLGDLEKFRGAKGVKG